MQNGPTAREKGGINDQNAYSKTPTFLGPVDTLDGFDWKTTAPLKHRPFKPKYHLTMGRQLLEAQPQMQLLTIQRSTGENRCQ